MSNLLFTIKFTFEHCTQQMSFRDMKTHIRAVAKLSTTLCRKPTNFTSLLHFQSNHSLKCKDSIIFSQALRNNLLIPDNTTLQNELDSLTIFVLARQYPLDIISWNIVKALLLQPSRRSNPKSLLSVVVPYSLESKHFSQSVRDHWHIT